MFKNREEAGRSLAQEFGEKIKKLRDLVVVALPRGGVPVAFEIAQRLKLPLDVFSVKKIGAPDNPEVALGAVTEDGEVFLNREIVGHYKISKGEINLLIKETQAKAQKQARKLRGERKSYDLIHKNIILVDDGIATGATIHVAINFLRQHGVNFIIIAIPVCSKDSYEELKEMVDDFYVLEIPFYFSSVGSFYQHFPQVPCERVISLLQENRFTLDKIKLEGESYNET
ncbi:MAG: phosphoribosyltransferase [Bacteriovoracaceae bacterium]|jgi:putative phosphoribosyl transferase|nr:phosphoribosyltransferase [Bacteriovoracaceae bacterium]